MTKYKGLRACSPEHQRSVRQGSLSCLDLNPRERASSNLTDPRERLSLHYTILPYSMLSRIYPKGSVVVSEDVLGYGGINGEINGKIKLPRMSGAF